MSTLQFRKTVFFVFLLLWGGIFTTPSTALQFDAVQIRYGFADHRTQAPESNLDQIASNEEEVRRIQEEIEKLQRQQEKQREKEAREAERAAREQERERERIEREIERTQREMERQQAREAQQQQEAAEQAEREKEEQRRAIQEEIEQTQRALARQQEQEAEEARRAQREAEQAAREQERERQRQIEAIQEDIARRQIELEKQKIREADQAQQEAEQSQRQAEREARRVERERQELVKREQERQEAALREMENLQRAREALKAQQNGNNSNEDANRKAGKAIERAQRNLEILTKQKAEDTERKLKIQQFGQQKEYQQDQPPAVQDLLPDVGQDRQEALRAIKNQLRQQQRELDAFKAENPVPDTQIPDAQSERMNASLARIRQQLDLAKEQDIGAQQSPEIFFDQGANGYAPQGMSAENSQQIVPSLPNTSSRALQNKQKQIKENLAASLRNQGSPSTQSELGWQPDRQRPGVEFIDTNDGNRIYRSTPDASYLNNAWVTKQNLKLGLNNPTTSKVQNNDSYNNFEESLLIPIAPPTISVDENIRIVKTLNPEGRYVNMTTVINSDVLYDIYKSGGTMDYKNKFGTQYVDFGNFNFGATMAALGFPDEFILAGAGIYQKTGPTSSKNFTWAESYWDDPRDQYWIKRGIKYYNDKYISNK